MTVTIGRRGLLIALGGATVAWPRLVLAQRAGKAVPRVGALLFGTPETEPNVGAFRRGLRDLGYVEAQNLVIEYRYAEGKPERLRARRERPRCCRPAECSQQSPPSDGDCHTPLPSEVRKGMIPRHERAVP